MSNTRVPAALRSRVIARAGSVCEYCLVHEDDTFLGCHIDHIVSEKHGGETTAGNLALACAVCNLRKGSDIGSMLPGTREFSRFFHPRMDVWNAHFALSDDAATIGALTAAGVVTARILGLNDPERQLERTVLRSIGRYPTGAALRRMNSLPETD